MPFTLIKKESEKNDHLLEFSFLIFLIYALNFSQIQLINATELSV